jgi:hypothetical protein
MMDRWKIAIEIRPHSTGAGAEVDKQAAGFADGPAYFYVTATDIEEALRYAKCFAEGIESHPRVWMAQIVGIVKLDAVGRSVR